MFLFSSQKFTKDMFHQKADNVPGHVIDAFFISTHISIRLSTDYCEVALRMTPYRITYYMYNTSQKEIPHAVVTHGWKLFDYSNGYSRGFMTKYICIYIYIYILNAIAHVQWTFHMWTLQIYIYIYNVHVHENIIWFWVQLMEQIAYQIYLCLWSYLCDMLPHYCGEDVYEWAHTCIKAWTI